MSSGTPVPVRQPVPASSAGTAGTKKHEGTSPWKQMRQRFLRNKLAVVGLVTVIVLGFAALFAPQIAPYDPEAIDLFNTNAPPSWLANPSDFSHPMGTDDLGRDVFTRVLYGARVSLAVGLAAMALSIAIGCVAGAIAGYFGGRVDNLIMRFVDVMLSFPTIFLLIILAAFTTVDVWGMVLIIGFTSWMTVARLVRGEFLSLKTMEFAEAARALGASDARLMFRHLLPNALPPIIVSATLGVGYAILSETALSYLGVGIQPPTPSWGNMLSNAQAYFATAPWLAFFPGFCIFLAVLAFNFFGDGLRDALDPKQGRR